MSSGNFRFLPWSIFWCLIAGSVALAGFVYARHPGPPAGPPFQAAALRAGPHLDQSADGKPTVLFIGDSYTEGTGSTRSDGGFPFQVAAKMGWSLRLDGAGGTGYVTTGPPEAGGSPPIPDRVDEDLDTFVYNYVVVAGGLNDTERDYSAAEVRKAAAKTCREIRKDQPKAKLIVIGPFWPTGSPTPSAFMVRDATRTAAKKAGAIYVDPIDGKWITGHHGDGLGNAVGYIGDDGTHPTQAGHDYLAKRIIADLKSDGIRAKAVASAG